MVPPAGVSVEPRRRDASVTDDLGLFVLKFRTAAR